MREKTFQDGAIDSNRANLKHDGSIGNLSHLLMYLRGYKFQFFMGLLAIVVASAMVLSFGIAIRSVVDLGFYELGIDEIIDWITIFSSMVIILAAASYGRSYYVALLGERIITDLRQDVFENLLRLDINYFETVKAGELISRLTTDLSLIQIVIGNSLAIFLRNLFMLTGGVLMMLITSSKLSLNAILVVPIVLLPIILLGRYVRSFSRTAQDHVANFSGFLDETLNSMKTIQAFTYEQQALKGFVRNAEMAFEAAKNRTQARSVMVFFVMVIVFGAVAFMFVAGAREVSIGQISTGELTSFIFYMIVVAGSVGSFSEIYADLQRASGAFQRVHEIMQQAPMIETAANPKKLPTHAKGILAIHNINFAYFCSPEKKILKNFNLSLTPGENLAIVGPSGAGKSTLFSLILRFYDPQSGAIYLDGVNLKEMNLHELRNQIGIVPQDPDVFAMSIYENVRYANPVASESEILSALDQVALSDFIKTLPHGVDTIVGNRGVKLSGGQKQRIAIARAIVRNPRILLLDEATNALDAETELAVQKSLKKLTSTRTTITIAHRLSTVLSADRIAVVDHGEISAIGTHAELIAQDGLYRRLATLQFADARAIREKRGRPEKYA